MTIIEGILSTIVVGVAVFSGLACNSLLKAKNNLVDLLLREGAPKDWQTYVDTEIGRLRLRVEETEAHWQEMYAKFDRLDKSAKQRSRRSAPDAEETVEPVLDSPASIEDQKMDLRRKMKEARSLSGRNS